MLEVWEQDNTTVLLRSWSYW